MSTRTSSAAALALGSLVTAGWLAGCAMTGPAGPGPAAPAPGYGPAPMTAPAPASPTGTPPATPAGAGAADATTLTLRMADTPLGPVLVDGRGMTLYLFTKDAPNTSACEGQCLVNWPPLLGKPTVGARVDDSKVGSFQRADGRTQATYNGWQLYYWKSDAAPGETSGQGVQGVWFVLDRDGDAVKG